MDRRDVLTKLLAVAGTILVVAPLAAPLLLSLARLAQAGRLQIDYLMPAELFLVALAGGLLLLAASVLARSHRAVVGWSLGAAAALLIAGMGAATLTGLASGAAQPTGWRVLLVAGLIVGYVLALVALAVGGILLTRSLFSRRLRGEASLPGDPRTD